MKLQRASKAHDRLLLRWAAPHPAEYAPGLLRTFNPEQVVRTPVEAIAATLELPNTSAHFREDFKTCFGEVLTYLKDGTIPRYLFSG